MNMDACIAELPVAAIPGAKDDAIITSSMREEEERLQKETALTNAADRKQVQQLSCPSILCCLNSNFASPILGFG